MHIGTVYFFKKNKIISIVRTLIEVVGYSNTGGELDFGKSQWMMILIRHPARSLEEFRKADYVFFRNQNIILLYIYSIIIKNILLNKIKILTFRGFTQAIKY